MTTIIPLENKSIVNNQQEHRTLSDLIVEYLELLGIEYVFGIPGGHNSPLYEALARSEKRGGPRAILTSHELVCAVRQQDQGQQI
jgi:acetolactate synthase I/II/III large subunit